MQVTAKVIHTEKIKRTFKYNKFSIILSVFLISGIIVGSSFLNKLPTNVLSFLSSSLDSFLDYRVSADYFSLFALSFVSSLLYCICIFTSAYGLIGLPVIPAVLFLRGLCTSLISALLYRNYTLSGIAFADLVLLPTTVAVDIMLLILGSDGMKLSYSFLSHLDNGYGSDELGKGCTLYIKRVGLIIILILFCSAVEAAFTIGFIRFFPFK